MKRFFSLLMSIVMFSLAVANTSYAATSQTQNVRLKLANGAIYFGEVKDGAPHGNGVMKWKDNHWYKGGWIKGKRSGYGIYVSIQENNETIYQGNWYNNQYSGAGSLVERYKDSNYEYELMPLNVYKGNFKNSKFVSGYSINSAGSMGNAWIRTDFSYTDSKKKVVIAGGDVSEIKSHIDSGLKKASTDLALTYLIKSDATTYKGYSYEMMNMGGFFGFEMFTGTRKNNERITGNHHYVSHEEGNPIVVDKYKDKKIISSTQLAQQDTADYYSKQIKSRVSDFQPHIKNFNALYNLINFKIPDVNSMLQPKFIVDKNTPANIKKGYIPGLNIKFGMTSSQVIKVLGSKTTEYWNAGEFQRFESTPNIGVHFEIKGKNEVVTALQIYGSQLPELKTVSQLKKVLGKPMDEGINDVDEEYTLYYQFGNVEAFFNFRDKKGELLSILIKGPY